MEFEWDEDKRAEVLRTRGVDFVLATRVFADPRRLLAKDDRREYGETRYRTLGRVGDELLMVVYTMRGNTCRIITAWRARRDDRAKYEAF